MKTISGNIVRKPYHLLGKVVASYAAAVSAVGFSLVSRPNLNPFTNKPIPQEVGVFRSDTFDHIGTGSPGFTYIQPADSLQVLESARKQVNGEWSSVYVGRGGKNLSAFITLDATIIAPKRGDKVGLSIAYFDHFDGTGKARLQLCANVLACDNGMVSTKELVSFGQKHNPCLADRLKVFEGKLAYGLAMEIQSMTDMVAKLDRTPMQVSEVPVFAHRLFGLAMPANRAEQDAIPTRLANRIEAITVGFTRGAGNTGRTRWDMFNAVTEHLDYGSNFRETANTSKEDNRFTSLLAGDAAKLRNSALELLLN